VAAGKKRKVQAGLTKLAKRIGGKGAQICQEYYRQYATPAWDITSHFWCTIQTDLNGDPVHVESTLNLSSGVWRVSVHDGDTGDDLSKYNAAKVLKAVCTGIVHPIKAGWPINDGYGSGGGTVGYV
jgi:hypothetical protein